MEQKNKSTYYVDLGTGEISRSIDDSAWNYKIEATDEEITKLRDLFDATYQADVKSFLQSHIPTLEYHHDGPNDIFDRHFIEIYQMLHDLGDDDARKHIESMGILKNFTSE